MHESGLPPADLPPLTRSVAACLAAILELDVAAVPSPPADHPEPWTVWRNWLGGRGLGLVPVLEPGRFSWPGPWLALLQSATDGLVAAVAFGSPPGLVWTPLGGAEPFEAVELGYVVAPADVALWAPATTASASTGGHVEALLVAREAEGPLVPVAEAVAHAGRGLEGDRYHEGRGTFSNVHARGVDLTLVAAESLEALPLLPGGALAPRRRGATSSPGASTSTRSSADPSSSARCDASASVRASRARTSSAWPARGRCARSCIAAACVPTCAPTASSASATPSSPCSGGRLSRGRRARR